MDLEDLESSEWLTVDVIQYVADRHVRRVHGSGHTACIATAHFMWKEEGRGTDLMAVDDDMAWSQVLLARKRGCVDCIHVKFKVEGAEQEKATEPDVCEGGRVRDSSQQQEEVTRFESGVDRGDLMVIQ